MTTVEVPDFGTIDFPDEMQHEQILSVLDAKFRKPEPVVPEAAPFKGALSGWQSFAGSIPKGLSYLSHTLPIPIEPGAGFSINREIAVENQRRAQLPAEMRLKEIQQDPMYRAGQVAQEAVSLTPAQQASKWTGAGEMVGGASGMALGPLAIPAFAASSIGNSVTTDFERIKKENPKLTSDEAADRALDEAMAKGVITAATFLILPKVLRGPLEKHLVGKLGKTGFTNWLAGRGAASIEGASVLGGQAAGERAVEGKLPDSDTLKQSGAGALMNLFLPWRRPTKGTPNVLSSEKAKTTTQEGEAGVPQGAFVPGEEKVLLEKQIDALEEDIHQEGKDGIPSRDKITKLNQLKKQIEGLVNPIQLEQSDLLEREAIDQGVELKPVKAGSGDDPFARKRTRENPLTGEYMTIDRETGKVVVIEEEWNDFMRQKKSEGATPEQILKIIQSDLNHEKIHLKTTDADALQYHNSLTRLERWMNQRRYEGDNRIKNPDPTNMGHEALRFRIQQASKMTPSEFLQMTRGERWTWEALTALEKAIRNIRERFTDLGAGGREIFNRVQANIDAVKSAAGHANPAALSRQGELFKKPEEEPTGKGPGPEAEFVGGFARGGQKRAYPPWTREYQELSGKDVPGEVEPSQPEYPEKQQTPADVEASGDTFGDQGENVPPTQERLIKAVEDMRKAAGENPAMLNRKREEQLYRYRESLWKSGVVLEKKKNSTYQKFLKMVKESEFSQKNPEMGDRLMQQMSSKEASDDMWKSISNPDDPSGLDFIDSASRDLGINHTDLSNWYSGARGVAEEHSRVSRALNQLSSFEGHPSDIGPGVGPGMLNRRGKKQPFDPDQAKMFGVVTGRGQPGAEDVPATERVTPTEAGALPSMTGKDLEAKAAAHIESEIKGNQRPGFDEFSTWAKNNMHGIHPDQLVSFWENAVWDHLMKASPERLDQWRESLGLDKKFGGRGIAAPPESVTFKLEQEFAEGKRYGAKVTAAEKKLTTSRQRYRSRIISEIAQKLLGESMPDETVLNRKTVALDEIDFDNPGAKHDPWQEIPKSVSESPAVLSDLFKDQSRRSSQDPVSWTKNLIVLLNKRTGHVEVVSAYAHGRSGVMATQPGIAGVTQRPNRPLSELLRTYQPIYRILLKEPVQNFHEHFSDISDFNSKLGSEGQSMARQAQYSEFAGEPSEGAPRRQAFTGREGESAPEGTRPEDVEAIEGTPGIKGEGGGLTGPHADIGRAEMGVSPGEVLRARRVPMTATEAAAVMDSLIGDVGKVDSRDDMGEMLNEMAWRRENGKLTGRDWSAISALQKASVKLQARNPDWTPQQAAERTLDTFYEAITKNEGYEDYIQKILGQFAPPTRVAPGFEPGLPTTGSRTEGISREITQRRDVAPTVARREQSPAGTWPNPTTTPPRPFPAPERPARGSQFMTPEEQAKLAQRQPTAEPVAGVPTEPFQVPKGAGKEPQYVRGAGRTTRATSSGASRWKQSPAMLNRARARVEDSAVKARGIAVAWFKRRSTNDAIASAADQADNSTNLAGDMVQKRIQLDSKKPEVLRAVGPLIQAGAFKAKYKLDAEAQAAHDEMLKAHPEAESAFKLSQSKDPVNAGKGQARLDQIEARITNDLLKKGLITHTGVEYSFDEQAWQQLDAFGKMLDAGEAKARQLLPGSWMDRRRGRLQLKAVEMLRPGLDYARKNWTDPELRDAALTARKELDTQYDLEVKNGYSVRHDPDYLPGRFDGELFNDNQIKFLGQNILGRNFRQSKTFPSYYHAAEAGPYAPLTVDASALVGHRVRQGMRGVNRNQIWAPALKEMRDPDTGEAVAVEPKKNADGKWAPPTAEYELVYVNGPQQRPLAVRRGYSDLVDTIIRPSAIQKSAPTREILEWGQRLKHALLAVDIFHYMRLKFYGASIMGPKGIGKSGWQGGLSVLEYSPHDLARAHQKGMVPDDAYRWATEQVPIKIGSKTTMMSRAEIADQFTSRTGLNVGRIADAIYQDLVRNVPIIRGINKHVFDHLQRGLMMQSAVEEFVRQNKANPKASIASLLKDIAYDTNVYFGSLGRQGLFRSATFQDLSRIPFLAPQWVEGLVRKEMAFAGRMTGASNLMGRNAPTQLGLIGTGMAKGLAAMIVLTQTLNLITRRKPTWQNEEEGHKLDAWIPSMSGEGPGFWFSPLSVFQELTHDAVRLIETKPKVWDAVTQIGENKLSPYGRAALILGSASKIGGQRITTTGGVFKEAAKQFAPVPITLSGLAQSAGHAVAPGMIPAQQPGQLQRQLAATAGLKMEPGMTSNQQMGKLADEFMRSEGLKKDSGWEQVQTDEPSYTKLRAAIRNGDEKAAVKMLGELRKQRSDKDLIKAMRIWAKRPFTGSKQGERLFLYSLDDHQLELYSNAQEERFNTLNSFEDLILTTAGNP